MENYALETLTARGAEFFEPRTGAVSTPIYQSATFRHPQLYQSTGWDYSRAGNPTRDTLEKSLALLEHGRHCLAFSSGMAAISALLKFFPPPAHFIVSEDLYGGTFRLFRQYAGAYGFDFSYVDTSDFSGIENALRAETKALFIETPSNPMMKVTDIEGCARLIHGHRGLLITDNTFCSPYFQTPLELGSDFVVHSGSKYLEGHNDTLSGFIVHANDDFEEPLREIQKSEGSVLSPFDSWLTLRGIKTLSLRMKRHEENARIIALWLRGHPLVEKVFYTGFEDHPQFGLSKKQTRGHSGVLSFYFKEARSVPALLKKVRLILFAESLGGVESLVTYPLVQTHAAIPEEMRLAAGVNDRLIRLSVGIEDPRDLIADLEQAMGITDG
jgi:cystathionine gamma-synthase